jgi:hypothetical protein
MRALEFWKAVTLDKADFLDSMVNLLAESGIHYCVVGGQAVNAYAEPLVSLDLDLAVAVQDLDRARTLFAEKFVVEEFGHSLNVSSSGSDLRVQIQTDPRYFEFPGRSSQREVLGLTLPVARIEDVLQGKIWAASDPRRRPRKRQKDVLDIGRILDVRPDLRQSVPEEILRLFA